MLDSVFRLLKITVIVAVCAVFMVAINALINTIFSITFGNIVGEIIGVLSCSLPFNAMAVFGSVGTAMSAILAFLIAKKIFDLTSWSISSI